MYHGSRRTVERCRRTLLVHMTAPQESRCRQRSLGSLATLRSVVMSSLPLSIARRGQVGVGHEVASSAAVTAQRLEQVEVPSARRDRHRVPEDHDVETTAASLVDAASP